ncbi:MAG: hypothetical protein AAF216_00140 [Pseudomonadota bacterium]
MRAVVIAVLGLGLVACGPSDVTEIDPESDATELASDSVNEAADIVDGPMLGSYCYRFEDESVTEGLEIEVYESGAVDGYHFGTIHDEEAGYFAAFETQLTEGVFGDGNTVTFQTYTEVDGDTQTGEDLWELTADGASLALFDQSATLLPFSCSDLINSIWPPMEE